MAEVDVLAMEGMDEQAAYAGIVPRDDLTDIRSSQVFVQVQGLEGIQGYQDQEDTRTPILDSTSDTVDSPILATPILGFIEEEYPSPTIVESPVLRSLPIRHSSFFRSPPPDMWANSSFSKRSSTAPPRQDIHDEIFNGTQHTGATPPPRSRSAFQYEANTSQRPAGSASRGRPGEYLRRASENDIVSPQPRPKSSLFSRMLRQHEHGDSLRHTDSGHSLKQSSSQSSSSSQSASKKGQGKWDKRASRNAPPPPVRSHTDPARSSMNPHSSSVMSELTKHRAFSNSVEGDVDWETLESLPKVVLHPPEGENTSSPIKLYPPTPPQQHPRGSMVQLPASVSRTYSVAESERSVRSESRNTWGGMDKGFSRPAPVFRRAGARALPQGIIMPMKKAELVNHIERRMSIANPVEGQHHEETDPNWDTPPSRRYSESRSVNSPPMSPLSRMNAASQVPIPEASEDEEVLDIYDQLPPRLEDFAPVGRLATPPPRSDSLSRLSKQLVHSDSSPAIWASPPMIMITSETDASLLTQTLHQEPEQVEPVESLEAVPDDAEDPPFVTPSSSMDEIADKVDPASEHIEAEVDSPAFSLPMSPESPQVASPSDALPVLTQSMPSSSALSIENELEILRDEQPPSLPASPVTSPATINEAVSTSPITPSVTRGIPASTSERSRRTLSLGSMADVVPSPPGPTPIVDYKAETPKVIKKQKSLKSFFFFHENSAKHDHASVPQIPAKFAEQAKSKSKDSASAPSAPTTSKSGFSSMLSRPKSKPSLRIDVKQSKVSDASSSSQPRMPNTASSTSSTEEHYPQTPASASTSKTKAHAAETPKAEKSEKGDKTEKAEPSRGLSKRFSLTNMSSAFKRAKKEATAVVPQVPELPQAYKKDKSAATTSKSSKGFGKRKDKENADLLGQSKSSLVKESALPIPTSPKLAKTPLPSSEPASRVSSRSASPVAPIINVKHSSPTAFSQSPSPDQRPPTTRPSPADSVSVVSEGSSSFELENELTNAQLVLVSPHTRRNPAESLQDILGVGPVSRTSVLVQLNRSQSRRSVEAIVLGPLLMPDPSTAGMTPLMEDEMDELEDLNDQVEPVEGSAGKKQTPKSSSESSLESLSRSSTSSDPSEGQVPVTPSSPPDTMRMEPAPPVPTGTFSAPPELPLPALPSDLVLVDKPSGSEYEHGHQEEYLAQTNNLSPQSTETVKVKRKNSRSPEGFFRFLSGKTHSPKSTPADLPPSTAQSPASETVQLPKEERVLHSEVPLPMKSVQEDTVMTKEFNSLSDEIQLRSLHFESLGLGLTFENLAWDDSLVTRS